MLGVRKLMAGRAWKTAPTREFCSKVDVCKPAGGSLARSGEYPVDGGGEVLGYVVGLVGAGVGLVGGGSAG